MDVCLYPTLLHTGPRSKEDSFNHKNVGARDTNGISIIKLETCCTQTLYVQVNIRLIKIGLCLFL